MRSRALLASAFFALALGTGALLAPHRAQALFTGVPASTQNSDSELPTAPTENLGGSAGTQTQVNGVTVPPPSTPAAATPPAPNSNAGPGLNSGDLASAFGPLFGGLMYVFAWLAGTAGILLNDAVYYTVIAMGSVVNPDNLNAIGVSWRILRDLGNIILIFGFIAIGISTIIGYNAYGVGKRLPTLLIVAVFINFSLFATEAVIDVGNLFASEFYTQINHGQAPTPQGLSLSNITSGGISGTVMNTLALQKLYYVNGQSAPVGLVASITNTKVMLVGVLGIILFLILAFVLFSLTFILIFRFVALVLLMIVAPVGFAGLIVPGLEGTARSWWKILFEQTVTAPALLLLLYVALAIITDAKFLTGFGAAGGDYTAVASGAVGGDSLTAYAGLLLSFTVAMALLMACVIAAKKMGAFGASAATKWAGAASFGATAFVARRTVGRFSNYASKKIGATSFGRNEFGRNVLKVTDLGAKGSFDFRGSKMLQGLAKGQGVDLGKAQEGGYEKIRDDATKARVKHAERLELTKTEAANKARLEKDLDTAKENQISDLAKAQKIADEKDRKKAIAEANRKYKLVENRTQHGLDADGNKVEMGLNDYKNLPQKKYIAYLDRRSATFSMGILTDALTRGVSAGIAEGLGLGIAGLALGTAATAGAGVGATLAAGYVAGVSPGANKDAIKKLKKKIKDQSLDQLRKALASGGGGGGGGDKEAEE
ncbi:MAG TPA: hypothetical protein VHC68_03490 [Candidatus Paceibacterota bacterium]|nr:hypothetical protein [Candidatus Paceibacterota bacterium]